MKPLRVNCEQQIVNCFQVKSRELKRSKSSSYQPPPLKKGAGGIVVSFQEDSIRNTLLIQKPNPPAKKLGGQALHPPLRKGENIILHLAALKLPPPLKKGRGDCGPIQEDSIVAWQETPFTSSTCNTHEFRRTHQQTYAFLHGMTIGIATTA